MKTRLIFVLSVLLNLGLLAAFFTVRAPREQPPASAPQALTPRQAPSAAPRFHRPALAPTTDAFHWAKIESEDYRQYIANLRAIGCPEETIRDIIIADVNKLYGTRIAALYPTPQDFQFWRVRDRAARGEERAREEKRRELEQEKRALIKELLGIDYESEVAQWSGRPDDDDWRYGFLTAEQQEQVRALRDKYRDLERAIFREGGWSAENRTKLTALRAQREAELAQLLGPRDFEEYQLRNSWTARSMRESLTAFQPSEDEFRQIFQLRKGFDDQFGFTRDGGDEALRTQRLAAQQQLEEQIRTLLGEQRFKEYQLAQDERFRDIYDFTQRYNLPGQAAQAVYDMRRTAETARREIENNPNLLPDQRALALQQIADETRQALSATLGTAFNDYTRRDEGRWLTRLTQTEPSRGGGDRDRRGPSSRR